VNSAFPFFYGNLMHAVPMPIKASSLSPFPGSPDLHAESMESVGYRRNLICPQFLCDWRIWGKTLLPGIKYYGARYMFTALCFGAVIDLLHRYYTVP